MVDAKTDGRNIVENLRPAILFGRLMTQGQGIKRFYEKISDAIALIDLCILPGSRILFVTDGDPILRVHDAKLSHKVTYVGSCSLISKFQKELGSDKEFFSSEKVSTSMHGVDERETVSSEESPGEDTPGEDTRGEDIPSEEDNSPVFVERSPINQRAKERPREKCSSIFDMISSTPIRRQKDCRPTLRNMNLIGETSINITTEESTTSPVKYSTESSSGISSGSLSLPESKSLLDSTSDSGNHSASVLKNMSVNSPDMFETDFSE